MVRQTKTYHFTATATIFLLLFIAGCAQPTAIGLKFAPEDITTYKVTTEFEKSGQYEGPATSKPKGFIGGHTGNKIEMTFTRQVQSVDGQGNATAKITIKGLKYAAKVRDNVILDFDSSRQDNGDEPLGKLIGQSYTIEIAPSGEVLKVLDASSALTAVGDNQRAARLLSEAVIKIQHSTPALPATDKTPLRPGYSWSNIKTLNLEQMGSKTYERIYEIKEIKEVDSHRIAFIDMSVVPSSERAKELYLEQSTNVLSRLFDNPVEVYAGQLELDLTTGQVEKYFEEFRSEWVAIDPNARENEKPDALRMGAIRKYLFERID